LLQHVRRRRTLDRVPGPALTSALRVTAASGVLLAVAGVVTGTVMTGPADRPGGPSTALTAALTLPASSSASATGSSATGTSASAASSAEDVRAEALRAAREAEAVRTRAAAAAARAARDAQRDPRVAAKAQLAEHGWSASQFQCLDALWSKESGWEHTARNGSSGAYGIPQALPATKLASAGADWRTNPVTQIRWGLGYIEDTYGSPCAAWAHSRAMNWY
jgi:hypothetical protein